jgi:hypothetical protein
MADADRIQVQMPDGTIIDAPAGTTQAQIAARYQAATGKTVQVPESHWYDTPVDWLKNIGTGIAKGATSLATAAGDALADDPQTKMAQAAAGVPENKMAKVGDVSAMVAPMGYQPKTTAQRVAQNLVAGATAGVTGPGGFAAPVRSALIGGASAAGAEAAGAALDDDPRAKVIGAVLGGLAGHKVTSPAGNIAATAADTTRGVTDAELKAAQAKMIADRAAGVDTNLSQAMDRSSNIDAMVNTLAGSKYGPKVQAQLRNQPEQVSMQTEQQLSALPGTIRTDQVLANNAQEAATAAIAQAKQGRSAAWQAAFDKALQSQNINAEADLNMAIDQAAKAANKVDVLEASVQPKPQPSGPREQLAYADQQRAEAVGLAPSRQELANAQSDVQSAMDRAANVGSVPPEAVQNVYQTLTEEAAKRPNTGLAQSLLDLRDSLVAPGGKGFLTDANELNGVLKDAANKLKSPDLATKGMDQGASNFMQSQIAQARNAFGEAFQPLKAANAAYQDVTNTVVNPMKKSVIGDIAGRLGARPDVEAVKSKLMGLFDRGTTPGAASSEILDFEKGIRGIQTFDNEGNPAVNGAQAYQDAVKTWMAKQISKAQESGTARGADDLAGNLTKAFGSPANESARSQGIKDMLAGMARSQGLDPAAYVKGWQTFMDTVSRAAIRPGQTRGLTPRDIETTAGASPATVGGLTRINPLPNLLVRYSEYLKRDALGAMDSLLTSPEGVDQLMKLSKMASGSPKAQAAVTTFIGNLPAMQDQQQQQR